AQAQRMLAAGRDPREVVEFLATTLTNRLMHAPSQRLREAAERGDDEMLRAVEYLFGGEGADVEPLDATGAATRQDLGAAAGAARRHAATTKCCVHWKLSSAAKARTSSRSTRPRARLGRTSLHPPARQRTSGSFAAGLVACRH